MKFKNRKFKFLPVLLAFVAVISLIGTAAAQTTVFTYQGNTEQQRQRGKRNF